MSATDDDWDMRDQEEINAILAGFAPPTSADPYGSANWRGVAPVNRRLNPEPTPSPSAAKPTMFLVPEVAYDHRSIQECFDGEPVREGAITFFGHIDIGAGIGFFTESVFPALKARFREAASDRLVFFVRSAIPLPDGAQGDWFLHGLQIPFMGR